MCPLLFIHWGNIRCDCSILGQVEAAFDDALPLFLQTAWSYVVRDIDKTVAWLQRLGTLQRLVKGDKACSICCCFKSLDSSECVYVWRFLNDMAPH